MYIVTNILLELDNLYEDACLAPTRVRLAQWQISVSLAASLARKKPYNLFSSSVQIIV